MTGIANEFSLAADARGGAVSADDFKRAFRNHPAGVALITADPGPAPVALTATSVFSVSADPPVFVFALSAMSSATPALRASRTIVLHLLAKHRQDLAILGSTSGIDRFADASMWTRLPTGEPVFRGVDHWVRAEISDLVQVGTSTMVIATAIEVSDGGPGHEPLVYHDRAWHGLGEQSKL